MSPESHQESTNMADLKKSLFIPILFVLLWSTGFVGARYGLPYADALNFIEWRFIIAGSSMAILAMIAGVRWPRGTLLMHSAIAGIMIQGFYIWGVFASIKLGLAAGIASLITGLQPLLTGIFAGWMLKEHISIKQFIGIILGLVGIIIVLSDRIAVPAFDIMLVLPVSISVLAITLGSLYQKRFCSSVDFRSARRRAIWRLRDCFCPFYLGCRRQHRLEYPFYLGIGVGFLGFVGGDAQRLLLSHPHPVPPPKFPA